jgi:hypothetical protein
MELERGEPVTCSSIRPWLACTLLALAACPADPDATASGGATDTADTAGTTGPITGSEGETPTSGDSDGGDAEPLTPRAQLLRIAMALRGVRPSEAEFAAVEADPSALPGIVDDYLDSPEFGAIVRDLHNDALLVLADFGVPPAGFLPKDTLAGMDPYRANRAIMEAPLRLIEHVVAGDLPYSEIVTADYTLADEAVAGAWGLAHTGTGWQVVDPPSDRRGAGVLADSWLFTRHGSTVGNAARGRANAVSRALLCVDFLDRDIEIDADVNLADPNEVAEAVQQNPSCVACHQQLDPLATFFEGYKTDFVPLLVGYPYDHYATGFFTEFLKVDMRAPRYFGSPGDSLADLGSMIARDPRFTLCAAKRAYAYFHQVELADVPFEAADALQSTLIASDLSYKAMVRALVLDPGFALATGPQGRRRSRPIQLASLIDDLTGFRWRTDLSSYGAGEIDLMDDSMIGYHVLAGGIDAIFVQKPSYTYNATTSLALRALARQAASAVVEADFAETDKSKRRLFTLVSAADSGQAKLRPQLVALHRRFYGDPLADDSPEIDESLALFLAALDAKPGDIKRAWKTTLIALLQDVRIGFY